MAKSTAPSLIPFALLALSACATTTAPPPSHAGASSVQVGAASHRSDGTPYGLYLAGQAALDAGDSRTAADYFAQAKAALPDSGGFMKENVFTAALTAGDVPRAAAAAPGPGEGSAQIQALGILTQAVESMAEGKGRDAYTKLNEAQPGVPFSAAAALLKPWTAAAAGRPVDAIAMPQVGDRVFKLMAALGQARLFELERRYPEAETAYKAMMDDRGGRVLGGPEYGEFLERRGRRADALATYDQLLAESPDDGALLAGKARMASKSPPPPGPTVREGAAQSLMASAAAALSDRQPELSLMYMRLALRLDPGLDEAWLTAGQVMIAAGDKSAAREAYLQVGPKSPRYVEARSRLAWSYQDDDKETALKIAREAVAARPDSDVAKVTLADLLRADNRFEESASVLDPLISAAGEHADWRLYYMRAVALERSGRWSDAETDLSKALSLKPDQPEVLNYLGYSWVNRGVRVKEGMAMIQKAVDSQPDEGAYVDSLGWAYYRLGDYKSAVEQLEKAVGLDGGDAEINDHLGDAYWRIGRRVEAQFQWRAVLTLNPDPDVKARAEAKLASPLGPDVTIKAPAVASQ